MPPAVGLPGTRIRSRLPGGSSRPTAGCPDVARARDSTCLSTRRRGWWLPMPCPGWTRPRSVRVAADARADPRRHHRRLPGTPGSAVGVLRLPRAVPRPSADGVGTGCPGREPGRVPVGPDAADRPGGPATCGRRWRPYRRRQTRTRYAGNSWTWSATSVRCPTVRRWTPCPSARAPGTRCWPPCSWVCSQQARTRPPALLAATSGTERAVVELELARPRLPTADRRTGAGHRPEPRRRQAAARRDPPWCRGGGRRRRHLARAAAGRSRRVLRAAATVGRAARQVTSRAGPRDCCAWQRSPGHATAGWSPCGPGSFTT